MNRSFRRMSSSRSHQAFTLVEVLVALAIFSVLLVIILVPIRLAFDSLSAGRAKANVQQAAQTTMNQLATDLQNAIYVFPNTQMAGITNQAPYSNDGTAKAPYYLSDDSANPNIYEGICNGVRGNDLTRIDMILPRRDVNTGSLAVPVQSENYIVTYYARRLDPNKEYDIITNPVVLFRAQFAFRNGSGEYVDTTGAAIPTPVAPATTYAASTQFNADTLDSRYSTSACSSATAQERSTKWLAHNYLGEVDLSDLGSVDTADGVVAGANSLAMPSDIGLTIPNVNAAGGVDQTKANALKPSSTFRCEDSDGDGKIDRVTVSLSMSNYNGTLSYRDTKPVGETIRLTRTIDLPNVR